MKTDYEFMAQVFKDAVASVTPRREPLRCKVSIHLDTDCCALEEYIEGTPLDVISTLSARQDEFIAEANKVVLTITQLPRLK